MDDLSLGAGVCRGFATGVTGVGGNAAGTCFGAIAEFVLESEQLAGDHSAADGSS